MKKRREELDEWLALTEARYRLEATMWSRCCLRSVQYEHDVTFEVEHVVDFDQAELKQNMPVLQYKYVTL